MLSTVLVLYAVHRKIEHYLKISNLAYESLFIKIDNLNIFLYWCFSYNNDQGTLYYQCNRSRADIVPIRIMESPVIFPYASISKQILQNLNSVFKCIKLARIRGHMCELLCQCPVFYIQVLIYRIIASTKMKWNLWVE